MKTLVTGGAGFIGSHLCDALISRGYDVCCVDNLYLGREENIAHLRTNPHFKFHQLDVLERDRLDELFSQNKFDVVFHFAANSDISQGGIDHSIDLRLTFLTTYEVAEAMQRHGVKRLFFPSTSAVFGDRQDKVHEDTGPLQPVSFYGASKLAAEGFLSVYAQSYDVQVRILRFPNVVGERSTHGAIHDFIARLKKDPRCLKVLGNGAQRKPYIYVRDLIEAVLLIFDRAPGNYSTYHAGAPDLCTVREMAQIVVEEMGLKKASIEYGSEARGWIGDVPYFEYDTSRLAKLGFDNRRPSAEAVRLAVRRILGKE